MNARQRVEIEKIKGQPEDSKGQIESFKEEEETKSENLPQGLRQSANGIKLEEMLLICQALLMDPIPQ